MILLHSLMSIHGPPVVAAIAIFVFRYLVFDVEVPDDGQLIATADQISATPRESEGEDDGPDDVRVVTESKRFHIDDRHRALFGAEHHKLSAGRDTSRPYQTFFFQ